MGFTRDEKRWAGIALLFIAAMLLDYSLMTSGIISYNAYWALFFAFLICFSAAVFVIEKRAARRSGGHMRECM